MGNPSKDIPWLTIFDAYDIHNHDFDKEPFYITAKQIKTACQDFKKTAEKEVRILCYQAQRKDKPQVFVDKDLFLLPVKNGEYVIVKGEGYVDIPNIVSEPILFEPKIALYAKNNGLACYQDIISKAALFLHKNGRILLEIGHQQAESVATILENYHFTEIEISKDLAGLKRSVSGCYNRD